MWFRCYHVNCSMSAHATCLAPRLCEADHVVPVSGPCPSCTRELLWGELARRKKATERREKREQVQAMSNVVLKTEMHLVRQFHFRMNSLLEITHKELTETSMLSVTLLRFNVP